MNRSRKHHSGVQLEVNERFPMTSFYYIVTFFTSITSKLKVSYDIFLLHRYIEIKGFL